MHAKESHHFSFSFKLQLHKCNILHLQGEIYLQFECGRKFFNCIKLEKLVSKSILK